MNQIQKMFNREDTYSNGIGLIGKKGRKQKHIPDADNRELPSENGGTKSEYFNRSVFG